ncbi:NPCBM/NEW2 domain-containing protein [Fibrobacter succinogenes]|uniref:NPCBM/NEW2 domain-containing protein n=1 Tax=Fibrobacter succinogenes TaxID=833 RepID=UPI0013D4F36B|nr:NPCBM/NEW2 domain-containing protein [Fibrobacter succinogenes]
MRIFLKLKVHFSRDSFALWGLLVILLNFVMLHGIGFASDLTFWRHWVTDLQQGVGNFTGNYPPLYVLWLRVVGWIYQVTGLNMDLEYELKQFCLFPVILAHISLAHFVWLRIYKRDWLPEVKTIVMLLVVANPAFYLDGPIWGQVDVLPVTFCVWGLWYASRPKTYAIGMGLFMLGLLTKFQMIMFLPVFGALSLRYRKVMWKGLLAMTGVFLLVFLPFIIAGNFSKEFAQAYLSTIDEYPYASMNAGNLWMVFSGNMTPQSRPIFEWAPSFMNPGLLGKVFFVVVSVAIMAQTFFKRLPVSRVMTLAALNALAFFMILPCMHERYVLAAAVVAIAGVACKNRPVVIWAVLLSMVAFLNISMMTSIRGSALWFWIAMAGIVVMFTYMAHSFAPAALDKALRVCGKVKLPALVPYALLVLIYTMDVGGSYLQQAKTAYHLKKGESFVYDLKLLHQSQGYGNTNIGKTVDNNPLHLNGTLYLNGIGSHAPSKHVYALPENASRFTVTCGVDDESGNGVVEFIVRVDDKEIWRSGRMEGRQTATADLDIRGGKKISLETDELGSKNFDHIDWVNPVIHVD